MKNRQAGAMAPVLPMPHTTGRLCTLERPSTPGTFDAPG